MFLSPGIVVIYPKAKQPDFYYKAFEKDISLFVKNHTHSKPLPKKKQGIFYKTKREKHISALRLKVLNH